MIRLRLASLICSAIVASTALLSGPAMAENRVYFSLNSDPRLPECSTASVQSAVAGTLARAQTSYVDGHAITSIDGIREVAYRDNGISPLARRYCRGTATLTDGSARTVHYRLEEHAGFVGVRWNVEACLSPLDKWHVYGAYCSIVRPR
ncbi:cytoplasmic protein [Roseibium sp.]|uniref:cytoplasmic protein n=1 Tax=Roseibium sp. TaxID=1936156 RepID=UPI003A981B09